MTCALRRGISYCCVRKLITTGIMGRVEESMASFLLHMCRFVMKEMYFCTCKLFAFIIVIYLQGVSEINGTTLRPFCMHRHCKTKYCKNGCMDLSFLSYVPGKA